jgi:acyl transferase domain-containing protein
VASAGVSNSTAPVSRWADRFAEGGVISATYGSLVVQGACSSDAAAFGISLLESRGLDPQISLVLETSYSALRGSVAEPASSCRAVLADSSIGLFLGAGGWIASDGDHGYSPTRCAARERPSVYSGTAAALSILSGRVSYTLGLVGPCSTIDTACSSSLVAAHSAKSALKLHECSRAGVTGVSRLVAVVSLMFSVAGMLSALGRCHTFD